MGWSVGDCALWVIDCGYGEGEEVVVRWLGTVVFGGGFDADLV